MHGGRDGFSWGRRQEVHVEGVAVQVLTSEWMSAERRTRAANGRSWRSRRGTGGLRRCSWN